MLVTEAVDEARRNLEVCNACRYCEGFCAVFPAMERRRSFAVEDIAYLANLCHGCRGCFYACQYAPPHEFGINLPKTFAEVRMESYAEYAWPKPLAGLFERNGLVVSLAMVAGIVVVMLLTSLFQSSDVLFGRHQGPGAFYAVIPWGLMAAIAGASFLFSILALVMGAVNFWRGTGGGRIDFAAFPKMLHDVATLRNLGGGGHGCNDKDGAFTQIRRRLHHAMFYGFLLCFASTTVATFYDHFLGLQAPYPFFSLPVLLGTIGGIGMTIGTGGFIWLKIAGDPEPSSRKLMGADFALLVLLFLTAVTGLVLLAARDTSAMGILLTLHLGVILALFVTMPYSRFVHGLYRSAALLRNAQEGAHE